jgi:hypothetical protein
VRFKHLKCGLLLGLGLGSLFFGKAWAQSVDQNRAYLGSIQGRVELDGKAVTAVTEVREGGRIKTGDESRCVLMIGKAQAVQIGPNTRAVMTRLGSSQLAVTLDVLEGQSRVLVRTQTAPSQVPPRTKFFLRSRAAVMGVRGTEVMVLTPVNPQESPLFATLAGEAELKIGSQVPLVLAAGQAVQATSVAGAPPPQIQKLSTDQVQKLVTDAGGKAPEIKNREDFQKKFVRDDSSSGNQGPKGPPPPPGSEGIFPPPPPPPARPDPVLEGRVGSGIRVNAKGI